MESDPVFIFWDDWFRSIFPEEDMGTNFRKKYCKNLVDNEVASIKSLQHNIELQPNFLKTDIGIKNNSFISVIKVRLNGTPDF